MVIRISMSGAQNSGKSTQMNYLAMELINLGYKTYTGFRMSDRSDSSISRRAIDKGFKINEGSDWDAQYDILLAFALFEHETNKYVKDYNYDFWVTDRTILDHTVYTLHNKTIKAEDKSYMQNIAFNHIQRYPIDHVWLCEPISNITNDGARSTSSIFQSEIDELFLKCIYYGGFGKTMLEKSIKNIHRLPSNDHFNQTESINIRNDIIINELKKHGYIK